MPASPTRGPGSNQHGDKPPRPQPALGPAPAASALRAQARSAAEARPGTGADAAGGETVSLARFGELSRRLAHEARHQGLRAPGFRSLPIADRRTLKRYPDGSALVSIPARGRRSVEVLDDMVEGVIRVNDLHGIAAARRRLALWEAIDLEPAESATGNRAHVSQTADK